MNKDIENDLQKKADNIETKDFAEVWDKIEKDVTPTATTKPSKSKLVAIISSIACVVLLCVLIPVLVVSLKEEEIKYMDQTELTKHLVTEEEFFSALSDEPIEPLVKYKDNIFDLYLYQDFDKNTKGCVCDISIETPYAAGINLEFFNKSVVVDESGFEYCPETTVNNHLSKYKLIEFIEGPNLYHYEILTYYKDAKYLMDLYIETDNLEMFLTDFFI